MDSFSGNRKRSFLVALKKGNTESFRCLYTFYQPKIFAFSLRYLKVVEDAEGITQEVFIELWKNREKIDVNLSLGSFLFTIARNKIIDHFRKLQKQQLYTNYIRHYVETSDSDLLDYPENPVEKKNLVSAIKQMPEKRKIVFLLSKKFGLSRKEIADFLGISENTVKNQLQEALHFLRQNVSRESILAILFLTGFFASN